MTHYDPQVGDYVKDWPVVKEAAPEPEAKAEPETPEEAPPEAPPLAEEP
jgi:hypothetical protein